MNETFTIVGNNTYNLRSGKHISRLNMHSTQNGTKPIGYLGTKFWNLVPVHAKDLSF